MKPTPREEIREVVARARIAQESWRSRSLETRIEALMRAAAKIIEMRADALTVLKEEVGKLEVDALMTEGIAAVDQVRGWASVVKRAATRRTMRLNPLAFPKKKAYIDFVPRGVVGVIAPWNYPIAGCFRAVLPALLTGNAVVVKPSEYSPRSTAWMVDKLAHELPDGTIRCVFGDGAAGEALIDAGIDACVFTGSVTTGRKVQQQCARAGIPSSVEMGGKDAAIVLADCDLDRTVAGLTHWALSNAGQACGAVELVYAEDAVADELARRLARAWSRLRIGRGPFAEVDVSPLATRAQLEIVKSQVEDARAKGAQVLTGGSAAGTGLWYLPTVLDRCTPEMKVVTDETFGPVIAIVRIGGTADAIDAVNGSRYGLTASIWSNDIPRAERLAERLDVGVVTINNHSLTGAMPDLPWTGTRDTGFGIANSEWALGTFVRPRTVLIDRAKDPELYWLPYDETLHELGQLLADAMVKRLGGAWRIPLLIRERVRMLRDFYRG